MLEKIKHIKNVRLSLPSGSGLAIAAGLIAFCTVPVFAGAVGLGMAALVGVGTAVGAGVVAVAGLAAGAVVCGAAFGALGLLTGRPEVAAVAAAAGIGIGSIGGLVGGAVDGGYNGYKLTRDALVTKTCQTQTFNKVSQKAAYDQCQEKRPKITFRHVLKEVTPFYG